MLGLKFGLRPDLGFFQNALEDTAADVAPALNLAFQVPSDEDVTAKTEY